jgi:hypothetical protein
MVMWCFTQSMLFVSKLDGGVARQPASASTPMAKHGAKRIRYSTTWTVKSISP